MGRLILGAFLGVSALAQQPATPLPTYVGAGAAFNQIGTPRVNAWLGAVYPISAKPENASAFRAVLGDVYGSTVADIIPVQMVDPATKRTYYAFSASVRQGLHRIVGTWGKFTVLVGGDAGAGFSQASPSGINVSLAGSFTTTGVYQLSPHWAVVVPVRALWMRESKTWNLIQEAGVLFKP